LSYAEGQTDPNEDEETMTLRPIRPLGIPLLLLIALLWAGGSAEALDLVSEYKLPLKEKDRILGSLEGNYIVYGRPHITMYNNRGKAIWSRRLTNNIKPVLSPKGEHVALVKYADHSPTDLKTLEFARYDKAGNLLWKMDDPAPNQFMIADNGNIFGIEGVPGIGPIRIHLYDPYGDLKNILTFKTYHGIEIAPSGEKFIIDHARGGLEVFDHEGNLLDSLPVSSEYTFDNNDRYIAVFSRGVFRLYQDEEEVMVIESSQTSLRDMVINVEQNMAVLMAPKRLEVFELTTGKLLWEYKIIESKKWLASLDVTDDGRFIACGMDISGGNEAPKDRRHVEGYLLLFPSAGKTMIRHRETYDIWGIGLPRGVFVSSGSIILQTREKLEKFKITAGGR